MITEEKYKEALDIVKLYEEEQLELINAKRMTVEYFISKIPIISGKNGTKRLLHCLENSTKELSWWRPVKYVDELDRTVYNIGTREMPNLFRMRNVGIKTYNQFCEYKNKIIDGSNI